MDYVNGIKIYEAIVESKILETTQKQIQNLEKQANQLISETTKVVSLAPKIDTPQNFVVQNDVLQPLVSNPVNNNNNNNNNIIQPISEKV